MNQIPFLSMSLAVGWLVPSSASAQTADDLWHRVEDAINLIEKPWERPRTQDEAVANFKMGIRAFNDAQAAFLEKAPKDPRRWKAKLFEGKTASARKMLGINPDATADAPLSEVLKAEDADVATKGEASAVLVFETSRNVEESAEKAAGWAKKADDHLKAYPEQKLNERIIHRKTAVQAAVDLKTKPLELKFKTVDGKDFDVAQWKGKVVLIDFWATWCGPCVAELPNVLRTYSLYHDKGFEIIGISLDQDRDKLKAFVKAQEMPWPQYFDGKGWENEISTRFGITGIPAMWLVNKKGMVVNINARENLEDEVKRLLGEE